jgi:hypothetical protein
MLFCVKIPFESYTVKWMSLYGAHMKRKDEILA